MSVAFPRLRRALCALMATSPALWAHPARALDKASCAAAAEAGQRLRKHGELVAAREQLVVCANPECPSIVSHDCTGWLGEVQRSLASFVVRAHDASGQPLREVTVKLDGATLPESAPTVAIEVDPGPHVVGCEREGFAPFEQTVPLAEGERGLEIDCRLVEIVPPPEPIGPPPPATVPGPSLAPLPAATATPTASIPWVVWPLAVLGAAGATGFVGFGIAGRNDENTLTCGPYCTQDAIGPAKTKFALADVSLVVGVVALGAAAVALLWHGSSASAAGGSSLPPAAPRRPSPDPP